MVGPSSYISKFLLSLLFIILCWYIYMDIMLYLRIQNYPIDRSYHYNTNTTTIMPLLGADQQNVQKQQLSNGLTSSSSSASVVSYDSDVTASMASMSTIIIKHQQNYEDVTWIPCDINPLCHVTVKAIMLDHTNHYLFAPLATIFDNVIGFSKSEFITANMISFFHVFIAIAAGRFVASDNLSSRRFGVVLFQIRTFLDDLDGHVARQKKNIRGERSEIGTSGYYIDGLCDGLGCIAFMIGVFIHLKNNPPRRGYTQLQAMLPLMTDASESGVIYKVKVTTKKVVRKILCFSGQLLLSSTGWNRYIALYQDMLERETDDITPQQYFQQTFYLYEWGWHTKGIIGVTEPRRVSALTLADRVAIERGEIIGQTVGVSISFVDKLSEGTMIKYMTEGILLREMLADPLLQKYGVIIIDEAHERNILTDITLGLLKKIIKKRKSLKIIISSATIDAEFFKDFFNLKYSKCKSIIIDGTGSGTTTSTASSLLSSKHTDDGGDGRNNDNFANKKNDSAVILSVEGRMYPVKFNYLKESCPDYVKETVDTILKIHKYERSGDILAFLTGQEEVIETVNLLKEHTAQWTDDNQQKLQILPMYGTLTNADQLKVFFTSPNGIRKVVIATNIAETSVTIPGIIYVIDCGFVKMKWFDPESNTDSLVIVPISKAAAEQRAGRAGRLKNGFVYRLYTEENYNKLPDQTPPEMRRSDLCSTVLFLKALGIDNILRFDFPSPPPAKNLLAALETLFALDALDKNGNLTNPIGYFLAELPISAMMGKMLYNSIEMGCTEEILNIIAMLQVQSVFSKPLSGQAQITARIKKREFEVEEGDLLTLLNVYTAFCVNGRTKEWCGQHYVIYRNLKRAHELRQQLEKLIRNKLGVPMLSCNGDINILRRCITSGYFPNAAYLHHTGVYRTCRGNKELYVHPLSCLYTIQQPQFLIFCELMYTTKVFMKDLTVIKPEWLLELAPHYYHRTAVRHEDR